MKRVFGLETEYGITVQGAASVDVVAESIELVRSYTEHGAHMKWDYRLEDPHRDARGFRAPSLLQDTDESAYYEINLKPQLTVERMRECATGGYDAVAIQSGSVASPLGTIWAQEFPTLQICLR